MQARPWPFAIPSHPLLSFSRDKYPLSLRSAIRGPRGMLSILRNCRLPSAKLVNGEAPRGTSGRVDGAIGVQLACVHRQRDSVQCPLNEVGIVVNFQTIGNPWTIGRYRRCRWPPRGLTTAAALSLKSGSRWTKPPSLPTVLFDYCFCGGLDWWLHTPLLAM